MKILFKDNDACVYYIDEQDRLSWTFITVIGNVDISKVRHLNDVKVLYHIKDSVTMEIYPTYYEHNGRAILDVGNCLYDIFDIDERYTKDYTITNLKLI